MNLTPLGIGLCIATLISCIILVLFHYGIVQKNQKVKKIVNSYWTYFVISILILIYFIVFRWVKDIQTFFNSDMASLKTTDIYQYSYIYSKVFLLDLCPMTTFLIPVSLIIDKTKSIAKTLAPFSIIGSLITIFGSISTITTNISLPAYIFLGEDPNELFFMLHYINLILSIFIMLNCKQYTRWSVFGTFCILGGYLGYISIFINELGVRFNTTGLSQDDWFTNLTTIIPQYNVTYNLLPIGFPYVVVFWYSVAVLIFFLFILIKNITTKDNDKIITKKNRWYVNMDFLNMILSPVDRFIDTLKDKMMFWKK